MKGIKEQTKSSNFCEPREQVKVKQIELSLLCKVSSYSSYRKKVSDDSAAISVARELKVKISTFCEESC